MTLEERRNRLREWLDTICDGVTEAVVNDHIFWEVQKIIRDNPRLQNVSNIFYVWMGSTFVHSTVLSVRRQVDGGSDSISLYRFLLELKSYPDLITRDYHRSLYKPREHFPEFAADAADHTYDRYVGENAVVLDVAAIEQEIESLNAASEKLHHYADRIVAHYDKRGLNQPVPKFDELTACIGVLEKLVLRYVLLLRGAWQDTLLPTFLDDWKNIFGFPWIPNEVGKP
jgi:hypothetical protein